MNDQSHELKTDASIGYLNILIKGINFLFVQPEPWPPNFFMEISQVPLDTTQNTF